ncbi:inner membrane complex protein 1e, putative (IMC1e) [Plasmodium ovale wallikeri]|uniref:Inner membrane complex protein 1e, putative (IMC1e) n=1 Tax=Plasmodium ovale wallikeri TaxID=864142 RepID=A0A1A8YT72_PLAOA|nr:inner membrane complex protein 1e, putative (IMC1e) [Plasmodium ovale wallikeri]
MVSKCVEISKCGGGGDTSEKQYQVARDIFSKGKNKKEEDVMEGPPKNARILKPLIQEKVIEIMKPEIEEKIIEVPQVQYIEKLVEVPHVILQEKLIHVPKPVIHERIKKCPKTIFKEKIVEVPQIKIIDKIIEIPQYVYQEKIIQVPKIMVQERIIPVPKKIVKEKIVEIPQIELKNVNINKIEEIPEYIHEVVKRDIPYTQIIDRPFHVEKIVEVPHIQHIYRNIVSPQYRHIPKPVEIPMAHYRTFPIEKLIDRNVPVPVELQIVQEFLCPKIEARYKEIPVPVHVQRIIEHPIPKDAMNNPFLLPLYYQEDKINITQNKDNNTKKCFMFNCGKNEYTKNAKFSNQSVELLLHNDKQGTVISSPSNSVDNYLSNEYTGRGNSHSGGPIPSCDYQSGAYPGGNNPANCPANYPAKYPGDHPAKYPGDHPADYPSGRLTHHMFSPNQYPTSMSGLPQGNSNTVSYDNATDLRIPTKGPYATISPIIPPVQINRTQQKGEVYISRSAVVGLCDSFDVCLACVVVPAYSAFRSTYRFTFPRAHFSLRGGVAQNATCVAGNAKIPFFSACHPMRM